MNEQQQNSRLGLFCIAVLLFITPLCLAVWLGSIALLMAAWELVKAQF